MPLFDLAMCTLFFAASATLSRTTSSVIACLWSFPYSSTRRFTTWPSFKPPCPIAANTESQSRKPYLCITDSIYCGLVYMPGLKPLVLAYWFSMSLPFRILSSFSSFLNHWLILFLACVLFTIFSQSRLGPWEFWDVMISIRSPFLILYSIGTSLPLTLAPTILFPTALCTLYAKSIGVEPFGSVFTSPWGVKQ